MILRNGVRVAAFALLWGIVPLAGQMPTSGTTPKAQASAAKPRPQFFAGIVTDLTPEQITVSRSIVGRAPESHTFRITKRTRMSKSLRVKSRVTVRYLHLPEGDVALEIQIRPNIHPSRST
jgi:hypothetical protein